MTYDMHAHRSRTHDHLHRLIREGGRGWHDYALEQAATLEREDPALHRGLEQSLLDAGAKRSGTFTRKGARR